MREVDVRMQIKEDETSIERLRELLSYNHETGELIWKTRTSNRVRVGDVAGCVRSDLYVYVKVDGKKFQGHRVAWAIFYGCWPFGELDHINRNPSDNRIRNLRQVTHRENHRNRGMRPDNTTGVTGVFFDKRDQRFYPTIPVNGKKQSLGGYNTIEEAAAARKAAEKLYGYSETHGQNF